MQIQCPYCGNACEFDGELTNGQHLVCPFCSEKFLYSDGEQDAESDQRGSSLGEDNNNAIAIKCQYCGAGYEVDKSYEGVSCQCGVCNKDFVASAVQPVMAEGDVSTRIDEEKEENSVESADDEMEKQDDRAKAKKEKIAIAIKAKACVGVLLLKSKAVAVATKAKTVKTWKNSEGTRRKIASKAKATAITAKDDTIALWKRGKTGKAIICGGIIISLCIFLFLCKKDNDHSVQENDEKPFSRSRQMSQYERGDNRSETKSVNKIDHEERSPKLSKDIDETAVSDVNIDLDGQDRQRILKILKIAEAAAAEGDTINFYGFFPGMSRHDAQALAAFYNIDGNECLIHTAGEKSVSSIVLRIKAIRRILKIMNIDGRTYEEIAQAVANAVGDLQGKGTRTVTGDRWGSRMYYNEHTSQWYERQLINGAYLKLSNEGMRIVGCDDTRSTMPIETAEAKTERIRATNGVISEILKNMVDIPTKSNDMRPFKMCKYEVTQVQWATIMGNNPSARMSAQIGCCNNGDRPVENISWNDCQEFLKEFNMSQEVKKTGLAFRLPTVEEWEYACRAGAEEGVCKLSDGRVVTKRKIEDVAWHNLDYDDATRPVGLKLPNAFGLFDMIGNVSEWTLSFDDKYENNHVYMGGDGCSRWDDESSKRLWKDHADPESTSSRRGIRICASKFRVKPVRRRFTGTCTIDGYTWTYNVSDGEATITSVSPKNGNVKIPAKIGDDNYPVTSIGDRAFHNCPGLKNLIIPDTVKNIGVEAFDWCRDLISVKIGNSVTNISRGAFVNCSSLASITIPDSVITVDGGVFDACGQLSSVTIGNGVKNIGRDAFSALDNLASVSIGNGVITIGANAFYNCRKLMNLKIGTNVVSIGENAFELCESLTNVKIPDSVITIGNGAFESCKGLTAVNIPDSVVSIGNSAFASCSGLTNLKIGKRVETIGAAAFIDCSGLTAVDIPDSVVVIGGGAIMGAFMRCGLITVTLGKGVKEIGEYAFWHCQDLKSMVIPDSVTSIGESAFSQCGLTSLIIGKGLKCIENEVFDHCKLSNVIIPDNVESIGDGAFECCDTLTSVTIGNGVTRIGDSAFAGCWSLANVKFGKNVMTIGNRSFYECETLKSAVLPNSVESIGAEAFRDCKSLASVTMPESVMGIGKDAFWRCRNLKDVKAPKRFLPLKTK